MPLHVGEAALCTEVSQRLLAEFGMYATPINYPTVPRGEERLRFTPGPLHTDAMMDELVAALTAILLPARTRGGVKAGVAECVGQAASSADLADCLTTLATDRSRQSGDQISAC